MSRVIESWLAAEAACHGNPTKAAAVRRMNRALGTNYQSGIVNVWLLGTREPCSKTRDYMLMRTVAWVLEMHGGSMGDNPPAVIRALTDLTKEDMRRDRA